MCEHTLPFFVTGLLGFVVNLSAWLLSYRAPCKYVVLLPSVGVILPSLSSIGFVTSTRVCLILRMFVACLFSCASFNCYTIISSVSNAFSVLLIADDSLSVVGETKHFVLIPFELNIGLYSNLCYSSSSSNTLTRLLGFNLWDGSVTISFLLFLRYPY